jgi:ADP-ribose pyrophosphatase
VHPGAVAILCIDGLGRIGVISQYRATVDRVTIEIPAGTCDVAGELPLETAKRELEEEMGCRADRWTLLGRFMNSPGWTNQVMHIFEARDLTSCAPAPAGPEELQATTQWLLPSELRDALLAEPAVDSTMAVALNRVFGTYFDGI